MKRSSSVTSPIFDSTLELVETVTHTNRSSDDVTEGSMLSMHRVVEKYATSITERFYIFHLMENVPVPRTFQTEHADSDETYVRYSSEEDILHVLVLIGQHPLRRAENITQR